MRLQTASLVGLCLLSLTALAENRPVVVMSAFSVQETAERLLDVLRDKGVEVVQRSADAQGRITIAFKNPFVETYTGRCRWNETHHEPLEAQIIKDEYGNVWLSYKEPESQPNDFGVIECGAAKDQIHIMLQQFASRAAGL